MNKEMSKENKIPEGFLDFLKSDRSIFKTPVPVTIGFFGRDFPAENRKRKYEDEEKIPKGFGSDFASGFASGFGSGFACSASFSQEPQNKGWESFTWALFENQKRKGVMREFVKKNFDTNAQADEEIKLENSWKIIYMGNERVNIRYLPRGSTISRLELRILETWKNINADNDRAHVDDSTGENPAFTGFIFLRAKLDANQGKKASFHQNADYTIIIDTNNC